jgi:RNA polymerase sigma-70 factor (ECF subfamily)
MTSAQNETRDLLDRTARGDAAARHDLLGYHRDRLRRMVAVRLDPRLAPRVDPSDIVQEALADAAGRLDDYLREPPLPFYPWLRQFAWERLVKAHRRHLHARRRSVTREEPMPLPDESVRLLARQLLAGDTSPSRRLMRDERRAELRSALQELDPKDREVLVLRHLEQMDTAEVAAVLGLSEGAVRTRQYRALLRLRALLEDRP